LSIKIILIRFTRNIIYNNYLFKYFFLALIIIIFETIICPYIIIIKKRKTYIFILRKGENKRPKFGEGY
jgi:hypothetical protein